jgi:hypothetical protein
MPSLSVDSKDAVAKERTPEFVPLRPMAKVGELGR